MGLFSWASDAWNGATHFVGDVAGDAWHGVTSAASDAWSGVSSGFSWLGHALSPVGHFFATHWKTLAAVAIGTVAFVAVATFAPELLPALYAVAPEAAPWLILGGAGAASGASTRVFDDLVNGRTPGWDVLKSAVITGAFTVVTAGTLQWLAPHVGEAIPILRPLTDRFVVAGTQAGDGAAPGGAVISVRHAVEPPVIANPGTGAPVTVASASADGAEQEVPHMSLLQAALRAPKARGIIGLISGDAGNTTNTKLDNKTLDDPPAKPAPPPVVTAPARSHIANRTF